jgi:acetoacetyl-CoA synthetase
VTYHELYNLVADLVSALLSYDLQPGDRVASYSSNCIENVAACLAATAIGCIWVSAAADFGPEGVLERFEQVQPTLIFAVDAVVSVFLPTNLFVLFMLRLKV